jgi:hypothetical protein
MLEFAAARDYLGRRRDLELVWAESMELRLEAEDLRQRTLALREEIARTMARSGRRIGPAGLDTGRADRLPAARSA